MLSPPTHNFFGLKRKIWQKLDFLIKRYQKFCSQVYIWCLLYIYSNNIRHITSLHLPQILGSRASAHQVHGQNLDCSRPKINI